MLLLEKQKLPIIGEREYRDLNEQIDSSCLEKGEY